MVNIGRIDLYRNNSDIYIYSSYGQAVKFVKEYIVQAVEQETIDAFDAQNAPELIRCKDCKHGCDWDDGRWKCIKNGEMHSPGWLCADGKRRDG